MNLSIIYQDDEFFVLNCFWILILSFSNWFLYIDMTCYLQSQLTTSIFICFQHVLERGKPHERSQILHSLSGQIVQMSQHKFASNVVEKCFEYGNTEERDYLIKEIVGQTEGNDNLLVCWKPLDFLREDIVGCWCAIEGFLLIFYKWTVSDNPEQLLFKAVSVIV